MEEELEKLEERYKFLVPLYPLNYTGITKYFNYELRFNGVVSRNNLPQIKDRAYVINLDHQKSKGTHRFHYLLTETRLYTLILLKYYTKSAINLSHTTYSEYKTNIVFCVDYVWLGFK